MPSLKEGSRIKLFKKNKVKSDHWLKGKNHISGTVLCFIPGQHEAPSAVIKLDQTVECEQIKGNILILELRYIDSKWSSRSEVHMELCDFIPEPRRWEERRQGITLERNAVYEVSD
ncbi:MAG: hypothetical protein JW728_05975 [Candidatus Aureabacteria bacterium]|nr:hypothetical protein [Candidatus Auribacterota bacterium]